MSRQWWQQEGLDLEGERGRAAEDSDGEEAQYEEVAAQEETPV